MNAHPILLGYLAMSALTAQAHDATIVLPVEVTSALPAGTIPMDVEVDFAATIAAAKVPGVFDPNTVEVTNLTTGARVPHAISPHVAYGDRARVRWLVTNPAETKFEIRFKTAKQRPMLQPRADTPLIGVGDLLRYTGAQPRPIASSLATRLVDLNGDGVRDLVVTDYYTTEPLWPERIPDSWSPFLCYPGVKEGDALLFGNAVRLRYREKPDAPSQFFIGGYMHADVADVNGDGLPDLAFAAAEKSSEASKVPNVGEFIHIYLHSGKRDAGGMPEFVYSDRVRHPKGNWGPVRIVDLDRDGAVDFVVGSLFSETNPKAYFIRNTNPAGWPIKAAEPVAFSPGAMAGFLDVDGDGTFDSVCVTHDDRWGTRNFCSRVAWHKGLGGSPPQFGPEQFLAGIDDELCEFVSTVDTGEHKGVLVSAGYIGERILFYELQSGGGVPRFKRSEALAINAPLRGGDQPTPFICDWNADGKWNLVYGGGFGWVRVFINEGTNEMPSLTPGQHAMSEGKPINLHMTQFFPGIADYWHDLGYVHPSFVDWDGDGLRDLVVPNVGNRIYWYRNVGTRSAPTFGPRQQVICDGYEETPERTAATARALGAETKQWKTFPLDAASSPFWWRARAGFGDLNGDGLMDLVTADAGTSSEAKPFAEGISLFVQYRDEQGRLRLRRDHVLATHNVRYQPPSQSIVHDWDGDGLLDLVINLGATMKAGPAVLRNIGTKTAPKFDQPSRLACYGEELNGITKHGPYLGVGDMDGDGRPDLIASTETGSYVFFRRTALDMDKPPTTRFGQARVVAVEDARKQRHEAAHRPRRLVFHSDGVAMNPQHAYHEPTPSVIPHLPGTQTDACTYSLIHQFPVVRLYRSKAGQEWPPGITEKLFGSGPDGLDDYITFCRKHGYEAWWAMRTNDTHDATTDAHGEERWKSNLWKQAHLELLFGKRGDPHPPFGNSTAFDYAQSAVRDKVFEVVSEVAENYPVDGLVLDFFRHLPTFKSTAWGRKEATDDERAALTALMVRLRDTRDALGMARGRPVLLAVRTPDTFEYCRALGLDLEQWMKQGLIEVWITSGYFRLQEWDDIVKLAHRHDIPVWAATDESRVKERENKNSLEAYRARIMNMRRAGVDAVWVFNYFRFPHEPEFQLLKEAGSIETLAFTDKLYVPDDLGPSYARLYLADGLSYVRRQKYFAPTEPETLVPGQSRQIELRVGDDPGSAPAHGFTAAATLQLQADGTTDDLQLTLNDTPLPRAAPRAGWIDFTATPPLIKTGVNRITIRRGHSAVGDAVLKDLQLAIRNRPTTPQ